MKTRHVHRHLELGRFWFLLPMLGALTVLILLTAWPALFAGPLPASDAVRSATRAATVPYESSDPSLPPASQVFTGSNRDVSPVVEAF